MIFTKRTQIEIFADICFLIYLITEFIFKHTIIGQIGILLLITSVILLFLDKKKIQLNYYFFFLIIFIAYNYLNTINGVSINKSTSIEMINTLMLNCIILFFVYNYTVIRNNISKTLDIFVNAGLLFSFFVIIFEIKDLFSQRLGGDYTLFGYSFSINSNTVAIIAAWEHAKILDNLLR